MPRVPLRHVQKVGSMGLLPSHMNPRIPTVSRYLAFLDIVDAVTTAVPFVVAVVYCCFVLAAAAVSKAPPGSVECGVVDDGKGGVLRLSCPSNKCCSQYGTCICHGRIIEGVFKFSRCSS
jgi:hypothetical protein